MENSESLIPSAEIVETDHGLVVKMYWTGVDRSSTGGIGINGDSRKLAERLVSAVHAGAVYSDPEIHTDVNGKTFVHARCAVRARALNADLNRIGF